MKTTNYNIRLDPEIKARAEETYAAFGLNLSEAINVFLHMSIKRQGFPFEVREPRLKADVLAAMHETEQMLNDYELGLRPVPAYSSTREMFAAMDAEDAAEGDNE
jgi:DNA-damage-inducible protein J